MAHSKDRGLDQKTRYEIRDTKSLDNGGKESKLTIISNSFGSIFLLATAAVSFGSFTLLGFGALVRMLAMLDRNYGEIAVYMAMSLGAGIWSAGRLIKKFREEKKTDENRVEGRPGLRVSILEFAILLAMSITVLSVSPVTSFFRSDYMTGNFNAQIKVLDDPHESARSGAARRLGDIGDNRAVPYLIDALDDEGKLVRFQAVKALGSLGDPIAVEPIIKLLTDERFFVREAAAEALGNIGDPRALEPLKQLLDDKFPKVRKAAQDAIEAIEEKQKDAPEKPARKDVPLYGIEPLTASIAVSGTRPVCSA